MRGLGQDVLFQRTQRGPRVDAEVRGQPGPGPAQRGQRVALPPGLVQGQREQPPGLFAQRLLGGQPVQGGDGLRGLAEPERRGGLPLSAHQPQLVQPGRFQVGPGQAAELLERRAAPAGQRGGQPAVRGGRVVQPGGLMDLVLERPGIDRGPAGAGSRTRAAR